MGRCLELAAQGRGLVGNGAMVGAVLVREGTVIAEGFHHGFGLPHAERDLVEKFDQKISSSDTLYVNLEPCCHEGKTPPCTDLLIEKDVKRVVVGMADPDPRVSGKGIAQLRESGIEILGPVLEPQCAWLNRGFSSLRTQGRPWITLKQARTQSGDIAGTDGSPLAITSQEQNVWTHTQLRATHDAILVGIGTVLSDNPLLNTRFDQNKKSDQEIPYRLVLDKNLEIPLNSKILTDGDQSRTIVIASDQSDPLLEKKIIDAGARVMRVPCDDRGLFVWEALWQALCTPNGDYHGLTSILVEGGRKTWEHFKEAGVVDEEVILVGA